MDVKNLSNDFGVEITNFDCSNKIKLDEIKFLKSTIISRIYGALLGACLFFVVTNFGVWSLGSYGYTFEGLILCYTLAIPFFAYTLISTLIFSSIIEGLYMAYKKSYKIS